MADGHKFVGHVFVALLMNGCPHCTTLYNAVQSGPLGKFILMENTVLSQMNEKDTSLPVALKAFVAKFKQENKNGFPQTYCIKGDPQYENYTVGTPVMGYNASAGILQLMKQAASQCAGQ
jgi:hypothetical protein